LSEKEELYPMFLRNPELPYDAITNPETAEYVGNKPGLQAAHTGLIVYNLVADIDKDLCLGLNQWDGTQWACFESQLGNAKFTPVSCTDITVNGAYVQGSPTTSQNYITMKLNVTKTGAFRITVNSGNGYTFYLSGVALGLGIMPVDIPCQGTPTNIGPNNLVFEGVTLVGGCQPTVTVLSAAAVYSLNCSSIVVNQAVTYLKGAAFSTGSGHTIELYVTVTTAGTYSITTPLTNGIRFSGSGTLAVGTQLVTLDGSGTPTVNADFAININANTSEGNATCSAIIPVTLPAMTYAVIGVYDTYAYSWYNNNAGSRRVALGNTTNFGPFGTVKIQSLTHIWKATGGDNPYSNSAANALDSLNNAVRQPDIILFNAYGFTSTATLANALVAYIKKGGCVIYGSSDGDASQVNTIIGGVFGLNTATNQSGGPDDNVYPIANLPSDPVINGPFGNLAGSYWGEDNGSTGSIILTQLPPNSVQVCTARSANKTSQNPAYSIVWYNDSFNFFYFGDSCGSGNDNTSNNYPAYYNSVGLPMTKIYGPGGSNNRFIVNAALELNAVAWGLKKAAVSGINPH
jgi:hypothetical protein